MNPTLIKTTVQQLEDPQKTPDKIDQFRAALAQGKKLTQQGADTRKATVESSLLTTLSALGMAAFPGDRKRRVAAFETFDILDLSDLRAIFGGRIDGIMVSSGLITQVEDSRNLERLRTLGTKTKICVIPENDRDLELLEDQVILAKNVSPAKESQAYNASAGLWLGASVENCLTVTDNLVEIGFPSLTAGTRVALVNPVGSATWIEKFARRRWLKK